MIGTDSNPRPGVAPSGDYFKVGMVDAAMARLDRRSSVGFEAVVELAGPIDREAMTAAWSDVKRLHPLLQAHRVGDNWVVDPGADGTAELVIEPTASGFRLTVHCDHIGFDGLGSLIVLGDLRRAYAETAAAGPDWTPRNFEQVAPAPSPATQAAVMARAVARWAAAPKSSHVDPSPRVPDEPTRGRYVMDLGPALSRWGDERREKGWPTDALLVGILERAWTEVFGAPPEASIWLVAQDMRSSLGMTRGLGNLSIIDAVAARDSVAMTAESVTGELNSHRADLLDSVMMATRYSGLASALIGAGFSRGYKLRYHRSLSNVGQLGQSLDDWMTATAARIYFVGPMAHPPYTSFIASGHGDSTWVTVRTSPEWLTEQHAKELEGAALAIRG